ncbi:MAG TPA: hypothetical protein VMW27_15920 [Thermoanaerobaculia bacterium]|nr:hypothetical protein [Thermoanaerobaculia bacterium]
MNVSGLRQLRSHWGEVIEGLKYLLGIHPQPASHTRYIDLWRVCHLGRSLPAFLIYRGKDPVPNGQLPSNVAGIYKVMIGLIHAAQHLAFTSIVQGPEKVNEPLNHEQLYAFVEQNELFIGPTEVCAGPESMIREVVNALKEKPAVPEPAQKGELFLDDEGAFLEFAYSQMNDMALLYLYSVIVDELYFRVHKAIWQGRRGDDVLPQAELQPGLLARAGKPMIRPLLNGLLQVALSEPAGGSRLSEAAKRIPELFEDGKPHPEIANALGRYAQTGGLADDVARYLKLEQIGSDLSRILKQQCLAGLGLQDSLHLNAVAGGFSPPDPRMRSLLSVMFGIHILPNLGVRAKGRAVISLAEDSPWP